MGVLWLAATAATACGAKLKTFTIPEPFGLEWGPDRVSYRIQLAQGQAKTNALRLADTRGRAVPMQLTEIDHWPDQTVKSARLWFLASLEPGEKGVWTLLTAGEAARSPASDLVVREGETIELANSRTAIRLVGGKKTFAKPVSSDRLPGPIQAVRLPGGKWVGKGWWLTDVKCIGYSGEVTEKGPVFARAKLRYNFEGGKSYVATVELASGQDLAVVSEEYNLSEGKRYPMSGVNGMRPEVRYAYVHPKFDTPESVFAPLAGFFQKTDPALARRLAWGVAESNNDLGGHSDSAFKLFDVGFKPVQPKLGSELFDGYGFVMRNGFPRNDEAYLQVYAGGFSWGHGHCDRGTWVLYARGAPLMMDFAAMYTPSMRQQWMHPGGLTFNHDEAVRAPADDGSDDWWRKSRNADYRALKKASFTAVEPRPDPRAGGELDTFGKVTAFASFPTADYAEMKRRLRYLHRVPFGLKPTHGKDLFDDSVSQEVYLNKPFVWTRRFVFVKDTSADGHNYLVIRDDMPGNTELDPYLNLWALATDVKVNGQSAVYTGQHGVDLHCYLAEPTRFTPRTRTVGHPCGFGFSKHYRTTFKKPFREDQVQLQIPQERRGGGYFVAMVPIKRGEAPPKFETLAGGKALRVTFPDRVDTIVLSPRTGQVVIDGRKINTPAALVVQRGDKTTVTNLVTAPK